MPFKLIFIFSLIGISLLPARSAHAQEATLKKLVHKRPPPIDLNPPKTSERNTSDAERGSEQMHQAANDAFEISGGAGFGATKVNYNADGAPKTSSQVTQVSEAVAAEYGFTHEISAGAALIYDSTWTSISPSSAASNEHSFGLSDPSIFVKGRLDFENSSLRIAGRLNFSLAKRYEDSNGNTNNYSGGVSLSPQVGYEYYFLEHTFGAKLAYLAYLGNRSETFLSPSAEATIDLSGGNAIDFTVFYEYDFSPMKLGIDFEIEYLDGTTSTYSGTTINSGSSSTIYTFDVYAPILLTDAFTIVPRGSFGWAGNYGTVTSVSNWSAGATARYAY
jgi:hypothetical protein